MTLYLFKNGSMGIITVVKNGLGLIKELLNQYDKIEVYDEECGEYLFTCKKEVNPNITTYTYKDNALTATDYGITTNPSIPDSFTIWNDFGA